LLAGFNGREKNGLLALNKPADKRGLAHASPSVNDRKLKLTTLPQLLQPAQLFPSADEHMHLVTKL